MKDPAREHRWKAIKEGDIQDEHVFVILSMCLDCGLLKSEPKLVPDETRYYRWTRESGQVQPRCELFYGIDSRELLEKYK